MYIYIYIYLFIHLISHLLIYSIIYAYHRLIQPAWAGGEAGLAKIMKIMKIMRHDATCWSGTTMVGWHIVASSTFHLHVRAQVRSKTPRVETSVVIANQHPQLPKKLNFVFVVVARMPPPPHPIKQSWLHQICFFARPALRINFALEGEGGRRWRS